MEFNINGAQLTELTETEMTETDGGKGFLKKFYQGMKGFMIGMAVCAVLGISI